MMFGKLSKLLISAALTAFATAALADGIYLGNPSFIGSGCAPGTSEASLSPDQQTLSILFSDFAVEAGGGTGRTNTYKNCNISIPVYVPQGFSVSLVKVDYRGYVNLPNYNASATFRTEYFFAGSRGPVLQRNFRGPQDDNYLYTNNLIATALVWSPCGATTNLRVSTRMSVTNYDYSAEAIATLDSADVTAGILYQIQWRRC